MKEITMKYLMLVVFLIIPLKATFGISYKDIERQYIARAIQAKDRMDILKKKKTLTKKENCELNVEVAYALFADKNARKDLLLDNGEKIKSFFMLDGPYAGYTINKKNISVDAINLNNMQTKDQILFVKNIKKAFVYKHNECFYHFSYDGLLNITSRPI